MSEYFDCCGAGDHQISFHQRALQYILEEFQSNPDITDIDYGFRLNVNWKEKLIQAMFDKSKIKMRMYGSAKEVLENLEIYTKCPGIHRYFKLDSFAYFSTPTIYENLNGQKYICKSDLFVMLQSMVRKVNNLEILLVITIKALFLKSKERLLKNVEFVPFDRKVFDEIWKEVSVLDKELKTVAKNDKFYLKFVQQLPKLGFEELFARLKSYIPNNWNHSESELIKLWLHKYETVSKVRLAQKAMDAQDVANNRALSFVQARLIIEHLDKIIKKRPEMFLPNSGKGPITVRLFEDGDKKFVMKSELFNALNIKYKNPYNIFDTISFQDALGAYKDKLSNIEFIRYPIQRAKHRAVPINGFDPEDHKQFCIRAVDALLEQLRSLIFGHQLFQKCQITDSKPVRVLFDSLEVYFTPDYEDPYFLRTAAFETMELACKTQLARFETIPTKYIRNAKADGFTVQNLKNELAHLGLYGAFPEIQDHAEVVYAHVDKVKKERVLRTCDLYDALEYCQLICFFERHPNYKKFLHNQGGCGRVPGLTCDFCVKIKKSATPTSIPVANDASVNLKNHTNEIEQLKIKISSLEAENSQLKNEQSSEISKLRNELKTEQEKSKKIEDDLVKKAKEILEIEVGNIKLNAESEANKKVAEQLLEKFSKISVNSDNH